MRSTGVLARSGAALARRQHACRRSRHHYGVPRQLARVFGEPSRMTEPVPEWVSRLPRPNGCQAGSHFCPYCASAVLFLSLMRPTELVQPRHRYRPLPRGRNRGPQVKRDTPSAILGETPISPAECGETQPCPSRFGGSGAG
jgi:hypothetical protein